MLLLELGVEVAARVPDVGVGTPDGRMTKALSIQDTNENQEGNSPVVSASGDEDWSVLADLELRDGSAGRGDDGFR